MATYKEIQGYVKETYGFLPKTCWIAHMKELCGIPVKLSLIHILNRSNISSVFLTISDICSMVARCV